MSTEKIAKEAHATWKGFVKVVTVTIKVVEAFAWLGLIVFGYVAVYCTFKDEPVHLNDLALAYIGASTLVISLRATYEFREYLAEVGNNEKN